MPEVRLDDQVFKVAQRRAADAGYSSVDEYIANVVIHDHSEESDNFDHLFTAERLAQLDQISAEIKAGGKTYSVAEVREHFERKRKAWLANHAT
jgi:hypothetical protein